MVKAQLYCTAQEREDSNEFYVTVESLDREAIFGVVSTKKIKEGNKLEVNILIEDGLTSLIHLPKGFPKETAIFPSYKIKLAA